MKIIMKILVLISLVLPSLAMAHPGGNWNRDWCGSSMGNFHGGGWMMIVFWLVILVLIIAGVRWLLLRKHQRAAGAVQVLEERYAKGEIDEEEFKQKRDVLKHK